MARLTKVPRVIVSAGLTLIGITQLGWVVWVVVEGSLHMGSPLRRVGPLIVGSAQGASMSTSAQVAYKTGLLGFQLLETSLVILAIGGLALLVTGLSTAASLFGVKRGA